MVRHIPRVFARHPSWDPQPVCLHHVGLRFEGFSVYRAQGFRIHRGSMSVSRAAQQVVHIKNHLAPLLRCVHRLRISYAPLSPRKEKSRIQLMFDDAIITLSFLMYPKRQMILSLGMARKIKVFFLRQPFHRPLQSHATCLSLRPAQGLGFRVKGILHLIPEPQTLCSKSHTLSPRPSTHYNLP